MSHACQADASWYSQPDLEWGGGKPKDYAQGVNLNTPLAKRVHEIAEAHWAKQKADQQEADQLITWSEEATRG